MLAAGLVALGGIPAAATPAGADPVASTAPATAPAAAPPATAPQDIATIAPELAGVRVDSSRYRQVQARFVQTQDALTRVRDALANAERDLVALHASDDELSTRIASETAKKKRAAARLTIVRAAMEQLAVESYVHGGNLEDFGAALDPQRTNAIGRHRVLTDVVGADQRADEASTRARYEAAVDEINVGVDLRDDVRRRIRETTDARDRATVEQAALSETLVRLETDVQQARALATVVGTDFTLVALDAYYRGAAAMGEDAPSCGIAWWALAGISKIEGRHGTFGGAELRANGDTSRKIVGIALDGTNETAAIGDTDGGRLDGDPTVDRAVGPMQFIPSTWERWARDGNGDGKADPNNLYDAAATAARYLCQAGPGLVDDAGLTRAFLSYNHSDEYAANVLSWAKTYRRLHLS